MKDLLWIGCLESNEEFINKSKKGYSLASAQVSQVNLIRGIEDIYSDVFDSINGSVLPPYPTYTDKIVLPFQWSHKAGAYNISVGYKNIKYINRLLCKRSMIKEARKWVAERYRRGEVTVFVYSMRSSVMATACVIKKIIPSAKLYLFITDLPQFMDLGQDKVKAILKKIDWFQIKLLQKRFDGYILYSAKMAEFLRIPDGKWMLMEGVWNADDLPVPEIKKTRKRVLMYSGMIERKYGLDLLIKAFKEIDDPNLELWITGGGNDVEYLIEAATKDPRIIFYGFLPSRKDVLIKQSQATMLINMRLPSEIASAYCFPSKLLEYMASGVPVLTFRLEGIPEEYFEHLLVFEEESICGIVKTIKYGLELDDIDRKTLGERAKEFVIGQKNYLLQAQRIKSWIEDRGI
ncbi:glycosyltransferase [Paenibacillus koleovorans]|uniref:glycosyltransferase n=1 Tax=Paenibacillus koleovorans TaxID=121608 RepID=UPI000FD77D81|nr:glycosyltransferase [Paenibacillus koleovorans]